MWLLRFSILFVAVFIYCFGMLFKMTEYIYMFWAITGAIYTAGVGAVIIGGLYWKRGSTLGAWAAMIWGSTTAVSMIILRQIWPRIVPTLIKWFGEVPFLTENTEKFPINSVYISFFIALGAIVLYVIFSLLSRKKPFNLERMLHRGKYVLKDQEVEITAGARGLALFGFDKRLPRGDKFLYLLTALITLSVTAVFIVGNFYHLTVGISDAGWLKFWHAFVIFFYGVLIVTTVWFTIGGLVNLVQLFRELNTVKRNHLDDGMVVDHHSLGEELAQENAEENDVV